MESIFILWRRDALGNKEVVGADYSSFQEHDPETCLRRGGFLLRNISRHYLLYFPIHFIPKQFSKAGKSHHRKKTCLVFRPNTT